MKQKEKFDQIKIIKDNSSASSDKSKNNKSAIIKTNKYDSNSSNNILPQQTNVNRSFKGETINNSMFENRINDYLSISSNNSGNSFKKKSVSPTSSCSDIKEENNNDSVICDLNTSNEFTQILEKNFFTKPKEANLIKNLIVNNSGNINTKNVNKNCSTVDKSDYFDYESEANTASYFQKNLEENLLNNNQNSSNNFVSNKSNFNDKYNDQLNNYLRFNNFNIILNKIYSNEISAQGLINMDDENLKCLIEKDNLHKFNDLKKFIINLDDAFDCDDLLKKIENFQGIFFSLYFSLISKMNNSLI